jgi:hypothetical protein
MNVGCISPSVFGSILIKSIFTWKWKLFPFGNNTVYLHEDDTTWISQRRSMLVTTWLQCNIWRNVNTWEETHNNILY